MSDIYVFDSTGLSNALLQLLVFTRSYGRQTECTSAFTNGYNVIELTKCVFVSSLRKNTS